MTIQSIQQRIVNVIETATNKRVISEDKIEGVDQHRGVFVVSVDSAGTSREMPHWGMKSVDVYITYYGDSVADCKLMGDKLDGVFIQPLKIDKQVVNLEIDSWDVLKGNVLAYSMTFDAVIEITDLNIDITMGDIEHITDENTELMGEIITDTFGTITKEE